MQDALRARAPERVHSNPASFGFSLSRRLLPAYSRPMCAGMSNRRQFLKQTSLGAACLATGAGLPVAEGKPPARSKGDLSRAYKYRIAFGAWINDMRCE